RARPAVSLVKVEPEDGGELASVTVKVTSTRSDVQKNADGTYLESGVYDLRLFRDGQLVGQWPEVSGTAEKSSATTSSTAELESWRKAYEVKLETAGNANITFHNIRLPQRAGVQRVHFTAYAFNSDRVKSVTTLYEYALPAKAAAAAPRRAYLITMGVNANQSHNLDLELAVSSARRAQALLRSKLHTDYPEVIEVPLYSDFDDNRQLKLNAANKADLKAVLDLLAGRQVIQSVRDEVDPKHQ